MPIAILFAALCSGALCASLWLSMGGAALGAIAVYIVSGNIVMVALLAHWLMRDLRA